MRNSVVVLLGVLLTGIAIAPSTTAGATSCAGGNGDATIVGPLASLDGATATFRVESATVGEHPVPNAPLPAEGKSLPVRFYEGDQQFLRVGERYSVQLWWGQSFGRFAADVHTAQDPCWSATRYADGSAIDTSLISRSQVKRIVLAVVIVPIATVLFLAVWLRRRHQKAESLRESLAR